MCTFQLFLFVFIQVLTLGTLMPRRTLNSWRPLGCPTLWQLPRQLAQLTEGNPSRVSPTAGYSEEEEEEKRKNNSSQQRQSPQAGNRQPCSSSCSYNGAVYHDCYMVSILQRAKIAWNSCRYIVSQFFFTSDRLVFSSEILFCLREFLINITYKGLH